MKAFAPITFTSAQVALMLRVALFLNHEFADGSRQSAAQIRLMACGRVIPTPSILSRLQLRKSEGGYLWQPK